MSPAFQRVALAGRAMLSIKTVPEHWHTDRRTCAMKRSIPLASLLMLGAHRLPHTGIAGDHELARANQGIDFLKAIMPYMALTSQRRGEGAWH